MQKILKKCNDVKGKSYGDVSEQVQTLKLELGVKLFEERNKQLKSMFTADKMK